MHEERCDLAVVGAGPAGMSAAVTAAEAGARVCVLDLGVRPGGQYWRWGPRTDDGRFHHGWRRFVALRGRYGAAERAGRIAHRGLHGVYALEPGPPWLVHAVEEPTRSPVTVAARAVLVATGAYDLQLPIPGWTLPGVMAAGGAQALLKGSGVAAGRRVVVAGTGPLLLPVAASLLAAGARVRAVVETAGAGGYLRRPAALGTVARRLPEAAGYALALARHRVPVLTGHAAVAAHGTAGLTHVTVAGVDRSGRPRPGSERTLAADVLATSYGFVPQIDLLAEAGTRLHPDGAGLVAVEVDADQRTSVDGLYAAGETTGVAGAEAALIEGRLAATAAIGRPADRQAALRRRLRSLHRFARLLQEVHAVPPEWVSWVDDRTVVCRCEEVTVAEIRRAQSLGADDPRSVKLLARPGMGWCQGRMCGPAVAALTGDTAAAAPRRPLAQPVPLAVLGRLAHH